MWGMKAPRSSAANTAGCLGRRLSAISRACGSLRLPPRPALADQSGNPRLAEPVHAIDRPARCSRLDEPGAVAGQSEPTGTNLELARSRMSCCLSRHEQLGPRSVVRRDDTL